MEKSSSDEKIEKYRSECKPTPVLLKIVIPHLANLCFEVILPIRSMKQLA